MLHPWSTSPAQSLFVEAHLLPKVSTWRHIPCPKSLRGGTSPAQSLNVEAHLLSTVSAWRHISCPKSQRGGTSPVHSLYVEAHLLPKVSTWRHISCPKCLAHEPSLTSRRLKLAINYVLKLKCLPENPAYSCVFEPKTSNYLKNQRRKFHLSVSVSYLTWRNPI